MESDSCLCVFVVGIAIAAITHQSHAADSDFSLVDYESVVPVDGSVNETVVPQAGHVDQRFAQLEAELDALKAQLCQASSGACSKQRCCRCKNCGGISAGASLFFAKPHMKESFQATIIDFATSTLSLIPFDYDYDVSPRVWLGYEGKNGLGVRTRYWQYDHDANPCSVTAGPTTFPGVSSVSVIFPAAISTCGPGDILTVGSGLEVHLLDVGGTVRLDIANTQVLASVGVRYASMDQSFHSVATKGPVPLGSLNWTRTFEDVGLEMGADIRRRLGNTALTFVGSGRGSLVFEEKEIRRTTLGDITPSPSAVPPVVVLDDADEVSGIFELLAGLAWERKTKFGRLFAQGTYETQLWTAAGAPTLTFLGFDGFALSFGLDR